MVVVTGLPLPTVGDIRLLMSSGHGSSGYERLMRLLRDILDHGLILVDREKKLLRAIIENLDEWPIEYRADVKRLLVMLKDLKRIVVLDADLDIGEMDYRCGAAVRLAKMVDVDFLIVPPQCGCGCACSLCDLKGFPLSTYFALYDEYPDRLLGPDGLQIPSGSWTQRRFASDIWRPLFRYTDKLVIIDKQIGKSIIEELKKRGRQKDGSYKTPALLPTLESLAPNFALGLEWICAEFVAESRGRAGGTIRIFSLGVRSGLVGRLLNSDGWRVLEAFSEQMRLRHGVRPVFELKIDRTDCEFPHDRYYFTDQVGLEIGRGTDLLDPNVKIRNEMTIRSTSVHSAGLGTRRIRMNAVKRFESWAASC
jgi:hypothetical protein